MRGHFAPVLALGLTITACSSSPKPAGPSQPTEPGPVATVVVSPSSAALAEGEAIQLAASMRDGAGATLTGRAVSWASSNGVVASVSSAGRVTAVAQGSATITATSEGKSGSSSITVTSVPVASVTVIPDSVKLDAGETKSLAAEARSNLDQILTGRPITWSSSNPSVATVSASGTVTAVASGNATVTATIGGKSGTAAVVVRTVWAQIAAGRRQTCALTVTGRPYCWGSNTAGSVGDGTNETRFVPTAVNGTHVFTSIGSGDFHACGLDAAGLAWCWGGGQQVGDGKPADSGSPIPIPVVGGHTFVQLAVGGFHTCGLTSSGEAWCWGESLYGRLGDGQDVSFGRSTPVKVAGGHTFASISAGTQHTCALTAPGVAYCWGRGAGGRLGTGSDADQLMPVAVMGGLTFAVIDGGSGHTCGLTVAGKAYCWGINVSGQYTGMIGDGTDVDPILMPTAVSGGLTFVQLTLSNLHTCGIVNPFTAYCWGSNSGGALGNGDTGNQNVPALVVGQLEWVQVSAGSQYTCGLTRTGRAYCWGVNNYYTLGHGTRAIRELPTLVAPPQ